MAAARVQVRPPVQAGTPKSGGNLSKPVKLLFPISLAVLAAGLNAAAVRKQINPTDAYVYKQDLRAGTMLSADHLQPIQIAGPLGDLAFLRPYELILKNNDEAGALSLEASLAKSPRILSKDVTRGELLSKSSLGGQESVQAGSNEEKIFVPYKSIRGAERLRAGQKFYLRAKKRGSSTDDHLAQLIGPFRVAAEETDPNAQPSDKSENVAIIYPLTKDGQLSKDAELLQTATTSDDMYFLTVVEKPQKRVSQPTAPHIVSNTKSN